MALPELEQDMQWNQVLPAKVGQWDAQERFLPSLRSCNAIHPRDILGFMLLRTMG